MAQNNYVHDSKDLSKMKLSFETFDPHSGIRSIEWSFGTNDVGQHLGSGKIRVNKLKSDRCPSNSSKCYCPDIGECEKTLYTIDLNKLVNNNTHMGDHNRNHFFTVTVYNNARLRNVEHLDILVDESPPESGVVFEGAVGGPDIDYTSDSDFIVRWHGYLDHESGVKMYRIGISDKCLSQEHFHSNNKSFKAIQFFETLHTETPIKVQANFTGKVYATVLAINNAMQSSTPVCSDGITRDILPPILQNISIEHAKWSESMFCLNGQAWLFDSELNKIPLTGKIICEDRCFNDTIGIEMFNILPELPNSNNDTDIEEFICKRLPLLNSKTIIYLPNDHVSIKWDVQESLSQIENVFVGFGKSPGEKSAPSMQKYKSSNGSPYFKVHHLGVGSDDEFYIFIKVQNKAKKENTIILGPIIIDETPPLYTKKPLVSTDNEKLTISWGEDQFYDIEQKEKIDQIFFQFVQGSKKVSPLLEWRNDASEDCKSLPSDCISYPLRRLQKKDTELGLDFAVDVFIYNRAGHFTKLQTDPFKIPSRYPPGDGVVHDIDPAKTSSKIDINVHFTEKKLCVRWTGFRHHENVSLDIGVGTNVAKDNILAFEHVRPDRPLYCLTSEKFMYGVRYFMSVRASCSGGTTVSSSNGVLIVENKTLIRKSDIKLGHRSVSIVKHIRFLNSSFAEVCSETHLEIGSLYLMTVETNSDELTMNSSEAIVKPDTMQLSYRDMKTYVITPYVDQPCFEIYGINVTNTRISIIEKHRQGYVTTKNSLSVYIEKNSNITLLLPKWELLEHKCVTHDASCTQLIAKSDIVEFYYTFQNIRLAENKTYSVGVKLCTPVSCSEIIQSDKFVFENSITIDSAVKAGIIMDGNGKDMIVNIALTPFVAPSGIVLYQWVLSKDADGNHETDQWKIIQNKEQANMSMTEFIHLPVHSHSTLYCCVRAYSYAGNMKIACTRPVFHSRGIQETNTVYDMDASADTWKRILEMIHSSSLGRKTAILHDAELNFGTRDTKIAAAVLYASQRNVTWYLMSARRIPAFGQCQRDTECITSQASVDGYILFQNTDIIMNNLYFICASSEAAEIYRETYTENVPEISSCSNGFILDDTPPSGGQVYVDNTGGFVNDVSDIRITLGGFSDNIDASVLGYGENLQYYSYAIGSSSLSADIQNFTNVGHVQRITAQLNNTKDGATLVVFIKATAWSGLSSTIHSKELVVDSSPPTTGYIVIDNVRNVDGFISSDYIDLYLAEFIDTESGIAYFEVCLGTQSRVCDITEPDQFDNEYIHLQLPRNLSDGNLYFINARAVNRAGLKSEIATSQFIRDMSPPTGGYVIDGHWMHQNDQDFQKDLHVLAGHWRGFSDPHSGMQHYRVGLGTKPYRYDVETMVEVGLQTDMAWNGTFITGQKYYITVDACNSAGLCTSFSSDGILLDNSPPITGVVKIGSGNAHLKFIPQRTSVHIQWMGFEDPQSDINHYEYCVGTNPYSCDIFPLSSGLLQSHIIRTGLNLPVGLKLYAVVKAFNWAGMSVSQTTDSFQVDNTPPIILDKPNFHSIGHHDTSMNKDVEWDKSLLRVSWKFIDSDSPIVEHIISIKTHHDGHTPIENVAIGNVDTLLINLDKENWLRDGDKYFGCCHML
ncbi:uncharacterized protein LOC128558962 [Mercenaria mercenaria]|uniref:uncharacterized protein LOC128558962 n=1 Tax=Mercenaria mercenaria TaxID=6596 RepID=UPI00234E620C|nr:uncharacterized protein LOC128558962 [Mercenaria mercenaria]